MLMNDDTVYELTLDDLQIIMHIFNEAASSGVIRASNMETVGVTYNKVSNIIKNITSVEDSDC